MIQSRPSSTLKPAVFIGSHKAKVKVSIEYQPPPPDCPFDHLVLVVHGIGKHEEDYFEMIHKMSKKFNQIFSSPPPSSTTTSTTSITTATSSSTTTSTITTTITNVGVSPSPSSTSPTGTPKRVKFMAIEWHSFLQNLLGNIISDVTPKSIGGGLPKGVRSAINDTFMDYVMFNNPMFASMIYDEVTHQLNGAYMDFIKEYPSFKGKISIYAHSLGSVISYDILSHQSVSLLASSEQIIRDTVGHDSNVGCWRKERAKTISEAIKKNEQVVQNEFVHPHAGKFQPLIFQVYNFITIGSPIGVLCGLRKYKYLPIPQCLNMYNIYNSSDPVSYLIEPLIDKEFLAQPVQYIGRYKKPKSSRNSSGNGKKKTSSQIANSNSNSNNGSEEDSDQDDPSTQISKDLFNKILDNNINNENNLTSSTEFFFGYRFDYSMRPKRFNLSQYATMLTSHSDYWMNSDVLFFLGNSLK